MRYKYIFASIFFLIIFSSFSLALTDCDQENNPDSCYLNHAVGLHNWSYCDNIINTTYIDSCYSIRADLEGDISYCEKIIGSDEKDSCFLGYSYGRNQPALCEKIIDSEKKSICYLRMAESQQDQTQCDKIADITKREYCIEAATESKIFIFGSSYCNQLTIPQIKDQCLVYTREKTLRVTIDILFLLAAIVLVYFGIKIKQRMEFGQFLLKYWHFLILIYCPLIIKGCWFLCSPDYSYGFPLEAGSSVYRVIYILALVINLIFIVSLSYFLYALSQKNILLEKIVRIIRISLIYNLILWGILTILLTFGEIEIPLVRLYFLGTWIVIFFIHYFISRFSASAVSK